MDLSYRLENSICLINLHEIISNDNAVEARTEIISLIQEIQPKGVVLHLEAEDISSLGIGCVIAIHHDVGELNIAFAVCLSPALRKKFTESNLSQVLEIFSNENEAYNKVLGEETLEAPKVEDRVHSKETPVLYHHFDDNICIITIHDMISNDVAVETRKRVVSLIQELQAEGVVLSLQADKISSLGIGCVIAILHDLNELNVKLTMCLSPSLHEQFIHSRLHRAVDIFTNEADAILNAHA